MQRLIFGVLKRPACLGLTAVLVVGVAMGSTLLASQNADAAVVCQKKKRIRLRQENCKKKETLIGTFPHASCPEGEAIRAINPDGTVVCEKNELDTLVTGEIDQLVREFAELSDRMAGLEALHGIVTTTTATTSTTTTTLLRFVDNGDGTITDNQTGLMWEKKDDNNTGGVHDMDNLYTWVGLCPSTLYCQPNPAAAAACAGQTGDARGCAVCASGRCDTGLDGATTTIWDWVVQLNATGFAGYDDWRIPEVNRDGGQLELDSLWGPGTPTIFREFRTPCAPGCTVTSCSCTGPLSYRSSVPVLANCCGSSWVAAFHFAITSKVTPNLPLHVRAVRGP